MKTELEEHPYINKNLARALTNFSLQNGPFHTLEDIKKCHLVTDEIYLKIAPYLTLD